MIMDIENNIYLYMSGPDKNFGRLPDERYSIFDYCFNYFQSFFENNMTNEIASPKNIQNSCLHLGFYLASWGMYRGSSFLLQKSVKYLEELIIAISVLDKKYWEIDVDRYDDTNIENLIDLSNQIRALLAKGQYNATDSLVTKIMLGVFGSVPAYDSYFKKGFQVSGFNRQTLKRIRNFYLENKKMIDSFKIFTLDYFSGKESKRKYSKAKIIDMAGFIEGLGA